MQAAASSSSAPTDGQLVAEEPSVDAAGPPAEDVEATDPKLHWVLWNKKNRQKAVAFAQEDPERELIAMRIVTQPFAERHGLGEAAVAGKCFWPSTRIPGAGAVLWRHLEELCQRREQRTSHERCFVPKLQCFASLKV